MAIKDDILVYLKNNTDKVYYTPTEIGLAIGKDYNNASSSVSAPIKQLHKDGLIVINKIGKTVSIRLK